MEISEYLLLDVFECIRVVVVLEIWIMSQEVNGVW